MNLLHDRHGGAGGIGSSINIGRHSSSGFDLVELVALGEYGQPQGCFRYLGIVAVLQPHAVYSVRDTGNVVLHEKGIPWTSQGR